MPLSIRLYLIMAKIVRGNNDGYQSMKKLLQTESNPKLSYYYGRVIGKPREYLSKENGFTVFKLYK